MTTPYKINQSLKRRIQRLATQRRRCAHRIMLEAVGQSVACAGFAEEAQASWGAFQQTGKHLTGQEIRDWLNSWGTDAETVVPDCHT